MNRAYVIKGPNTKAVLFAEKNPDMNMLRGMPFQSKTFQVDQITLLDGHPLKGVHGQPTLYVFNGSNGQQEVSVGTQTSGKWNLHSHSKEFAIRVPQVESILKSRLSK